MKLRIRRFSGLMDIEYMMMECYNPFSIHQTLKTDSHKTRHNKDDVLHEKAKIGRGGKAKRRKKTSHPCHRK